jgi:hypothetical protein
MCLVIVGVGVMSSFLSPLLFCRIVSFVNLIKDVISVFVFVIVKDLVVGSFGRTPVIIFVTVGAPVDPSRPVIIVCALPHPVVGSPPVVVKHYNVTRFPVLC